MPPVNPARAGMIRRRCTAYTRMTGKPRASGDDPNSTEKIAAYLL